MCKGVCHLFTHIGLGCHNDGSPYPSLPIHAYETVENVLKIITVPNKSENIRGRSFFLMSQQTLKCPVVSVALCHNNMKL